MLKVVTLFTIISALVGCQSFDNDILSGKDSGKGDAGEIGKLNLRQTETVDEFYKQGQISKVEEREMNQSINGTAAAGNPAGENVEAY